MKPVLVLLILFISTAMAENALAAFPFKITFEKTSNEIDQNDLSFSLLHAYEFVTSRVPDRTDRALCPIQVIFRKLVGHVSEAHSNNPTCQDKIVLDTSLKVGWEMQVGFVHELVHIIRDHYNDHDTRWIDEGLAKLVEVLYVGSWPDGLETELKSYQQIALSNSPNDYKNKGHGYVNSFFFMQYLFSHFGGDVLLRKLIESRLTGWENIEASIALARKESATSVPPKYSTRLAIWTHYAFALLLNDPDFASYSLFSMDYHYTSPIISPHSPLLRAVVPTDPGVSHTPWSITYASRTSADLAPLAEQCKQGDCFILALNKEQKWSTLKFSDELYRRVTSANAGPFYLISLISN